MLYGLETVTLMEVAELKMLRFFIRSDKNGQNQE